MWEQKRLSDLGAAVHISQHSPLGEEDQRVLNIRSMVHKADVAMTRRPPVFGACLKRELSRDTPIGDFVSHEYLCDHWSGRSGASVARAGAALDERPEELMEDVRADAEKGGG